MEKHVYFVRHGESDSNADGVHRDTEAVLTEKGHGQARIVAKRIARIGVDAIIASSSTRTVETAEVIGRVIGLPVEKNDLFVERRRPSFVVGRRIDDSDVRKAMHEIFEGYRVSGHRHSDEENLEDLQARSVAALEFLAQHQASRICVATHGLFLRVLFCAAVFGASFTGRDLQCAISILQTENTGITYLRYKTASSINTNPDGIASDWRLISWNDSAHLG